MSTIRILALDIETRPAVSYHWGMFNQNLSLPQMIEPPRMMCFGARWVGADQTMFWSEHAHGRDTMVRAAWDLLNECDVLMTYNGAKFDQPHLQREFLEAGLTPPAPYQQLDLYKTIKKQFAFISKKLDHVAQRLEVGAKVQHSGFQLWVDCINGDEEAWQKMEVYCRQDVDLLLELHDKLRPWIPNHPSYAVYLEDEDVCTACGSGERTREGYYYTGQSKFQRYRCSDCGKWYRGTKSVATVSVRETAA